MEMRNAAGEIIFKINPSNGKLERENGSDFVNAGGPHTHPISDVTNLQTALDGKSDVGHSHAAASPLPETVSFGGYLVLTNVGANYDTTAQAKGLGIAVIDFAGVASIDFRVYVNKVGTGTQSWQLWNVTDASEIGVLSDSGAAGERVLSGTINTNLPTGVKVVRIRAKSSVAGDDPVYFGASIKLS